MSNSKGEPVTLPKCVCLHEEDVGLLWKHVDYRCGRCHDSLSCRWLAVVICQPPGLALCKH